MMVLLWHLQSAFVGCVAGWLLVVSPATVPFTRAGRFLAGFSLTPFFVAGATLLVGLILPGLPFRVFAFTPGACALVLAVLLIYQTRGTIFSLTVRGFLRSLGGLYRSPIALLSLAGLAWASIPAIAVLSHNFWTSPTAGDASQYLAQAHYFASHRNSWQIAGAAGLPDGSLRGDIHGPFWTAYLASAIAVTKAQPWGFNLAAPGAIVATIPMLLIGIYAALSRLRQVAIANLAILFLFCIPAFSYTINAYSRDGFRLIPIMLLTGVFASMLFGMPVAKMQRLLPRIILCAIAGYFAAGGHTLAIFFIPLVISGWAVCVLVQHHQSGRSLRALFPYAAVAASTLFGLLSGYVHIILVFFRTGSLSGDNVVSSDILRGTLYAPYEVAYHAQRLKDPLFETFPSLVLIYNDDPLALNFAIVTSIAFCVFLALRPPNGMRNEFRAFICFMLCAAAAQLAFLFKIFDIRGYEFSHWVVMNPRYRIQYHIFFSILFALALYGIFRLWPESPAKVTWRGSLQSDFAISVLQKKNLANAISWQATLNVNSLVLAVLMGIFAWASSSSVRSNWHRPDLNGLRTIISTFEEKLAANAAPGCVYLSEVDQTTYYWPRGRVKLMSEPNKELFRLSTNTEIYDYMRSKNICAIVYYENFVLSYFPPSTPLKKFMNNEEYVSEKFSNGYLTMLIVR